MIAKTLNTLLFILLLQPVVHAQKIAQTYQLDGKKSKILWKTKVGGHSGYLLFNSGSLHYSAAGEPVNGFFSMDMNKIHSTDGPDETARQKTDSNIKKEDFFHTDLYPKATFNIKKITQVGSSTAYKVSGDLIIKGISKSIEFNATIVTKDNQLLITANVDMARQQWNIHVDKSKPLDFLSGVTEKLNPDIFVTLDLVLNK